MRIPIYQVDAFTSEVFSGNPAAVCLLDRWLDDKILQAISIENNLSETAFLVPNAEGFDLRQLLLRSVRKYPAALFALLPGTLGSPLLLL
jgi:PhzF family phenazine biosynthesis protein